MSQTNCHFNATNQDILSQIGTIADNMTSYANEFRGHISEYLIAREAAASDFESIKNKLDAISLSTEEMFSRCCPLAIVIFCRFRAVFRRRRKGLLEKSEYHIIDDSFVIVKNS